MSRGERGTKIYVDGDGCPVKDEVYKVAERYALQVVVVSNSWMRTPGEDWIRLEVVDDGFDAADDWIVEQLVENDIVVTGDIQLAARCLEKNARVVGHRGRIFHEDDIGQALAMRELFSHIRDDLGGSTRGPEPFEKRDRSQFLQSLDQIVNAIRRRK